jgi:hypothetical protein
MFADASSFVCGAAKAHTLARGAAKSWLPGLLGVGIGVGIGIELGPLDKRSDTDTDIDTDTDDQGFLV